MAFISQIKLSDTTYDISAIKLKNARNIALTGDVTGNVNFDGSGNVSIATTNKHGLLHSNFTTIIKDNTTSGGWELFDSSYNKSGFFLKSIRTANVAPDWILGNYASGIAFGGGDTKGIVSVGYNSPQVKFAGGNGMAPVWNFQLNATSGQTYTLPSTGGTIALISSNITGSASKWTTARTISIAQTAGTTGTPLDGSQNVSLILPTTIAGFEHIDTKKLIIDTNTSSENQGLFITRNGTIARECLRVGITDSQAQFIYSNDETSNGFLFRMINTGEENNNQANANSADVTFQCSNGQSHVGATFFNGTLNGSATKLTTARTIQTNLASTTAASFDGSANITPGVTGVLGVANGGTGVNSHTANRLVWSLSSTQIQGGYHYANSTKVAINSTSEPSTNFYVNGTSAFKGNITIHTDDTDRFINFENGAGFGWRIGYLGTGGGEANYLAFQSDGLSAGTYSNALRFGLTTLDAAFGGNIYPLTNNTKTLGTSSYKWNNVYATTFTGNLSGNAATATKLQTARIISLTGDVTGSGSFDGANNLSITATVADNSHAHTFNNISDRLHYICGANMLNRAKIVNRGCSTFTYNSATNTYTCVAPTGSTNWGYGIVFSNSVGRPLIVPKGQKIWFSLEIYPLTDCVCVHDVNNAYATGTSPSGNDNDASRGSSSNSLKANTWNKYYFWYQAPADSELVDANSNFGIVTTDSTSDITFYLRNIQAQIGECPTAYTVSVPFPQSNTSSTKSYVLGTSDVNSDVYNYHSNVYMNCSTGVLYGAAWNDYAEFRICYEDFKPGQVVLENGDDTLSIASQRLQRGCSVISDTFGFAIGETDEAKCPIAVSGRVLAYGYESREEFKKHIGWPVCSGPNGTVSIMTEEEEEKYPSRIIGTISAIPDYETWGTGNVEVNNRIWIKIK